ncbi:MAG: hypothetical protein AAF564_22590 [Bacteroidota bacterium]
MEFAILMFVVSWIGAGMYKYRNLKRLEDHKRSWKDLAADTQMQHVPTRYLFSPSRVEGEYRGLKLSIKTTERNQETFTEIRLIRPNQFTHKPMTRLDAGNVEHLLNRSRAILPLDDRSLQFDGYQLLYRESQVRSDIDKLKQIIDHLCDLALMYTEAIQLGGEAVPVLHPIALDPHNPLKAMAYKLLLEIGSFTALKFASQLEAVRCQACLASFTPHDVNIGFLVYYACRRCRKSQFYYEGLSLILVLDNQMRDEFVQQDNFLYVNGFKQRKLFDFDEVIIDHASDKEVASLALRIGNDTDAFRAERYGKMPCTVMENCKLSKNTMHMLKRVFGLVQIKQAD